MQVTLFVLLPLCNQNHDIGIIKIQTYVTYVAAKKRFKDINKKQDCPVPLDVTGPISLVHGTFFLASWRQANGLKVGILVGIVVLIFVQNSGGIDWQSCHVLSMIFVCSLNW